MDLLQDGSLHETALRKMEGYSNEKIAEQMGFFAAQRGAKTATYPFDLV